MSKLFSESWVYVFFAFWVGAMTFSGSNATASQDLKALVIGNSNYVVGALSNPGNDARLIAKTLEGAGFDVTLAENLNYFEMGRTIADFGRNLSQSSDETVGLFFYAGHAIQTGGENYLIPVDAQLRDTLDLSIKTIPLRLVMQSLDQAPNRLNMVFLDACRNNPFASITRSSGGGLARVDAPYGTLVSYSTAPGSVATDGTGRNSPYSHALAQALRQPGLTVEQALKQVRLKVVEKTGGAQVPWESSSLIGDFYFAGDEKSGKRLAAIPTEVESDINPGRPKFQLNLIPGHNHARSFSFDQATIKKSYEDQNALVYDFALRKTQLNGQRVTFPRFSVIVDFRRPGWDPKDLSLIRIMFNQYMFIDRESVDADYSDCRLGFRVSPSGNKTVRLLLYDGDGSPLRRTNDCVLNKMGANDRTISATILKNLGVILNSLKWSEDAVREMVSFYDEGIG